MRQHGNLTGQIDGRLTAVLRLTPADMARVGEVLVAGMRRRIDRQVDINGQPLEPLSGAWWLYKKKRAYDPRIWRKTGQAYRLITYRATGPNRVTIECAPRDRNGRGYAGLINDGYVTDNTNTELPPGRVVPPRRIAGIDREDLAAIRALLPDLLSRHRGAVAAGPARLSARVGLPRRGALERAAVRLFR